MHPHWFILAALMGGITTYLYRDWSKATTPGSMSRIAITFVIGVIVPHCVTPYWHPSLDGVGWPNYPDWFVASSVIIQIVFFVGFGVSALIRSNIRSARIA